MAFESKLLHDNRFGDPVVRHHPVDLPPSYAREPLRRFPVSYGLPGYGSQLDIVHQDEEFDDGHSGIQYRYDVSLPKLAAALTRDGAATAAARATQTRGGTRSADQRSQGR